MTRAKFAAIIALIIILLKLLFRFIRPSSNVLHLFEGDFWSSLIILAIAYIIIFALIYFMLWLNRKNK